jgi:hypothetical protein
VAKSTGPILAIGGITVATQVISDKKSIDWRVPIATGVAAGLFALGEKVWPEGVTMLAYVALVTVLFVRVVPDTPAPAEKFAQIFNGK